MPAGNSVAATASVLGLCSTQPAQARREDRRRNPMAAEPQGSKDATAPTCAHNRSFLDALPFGDTRGLRGRPRAASSARCPRSRSATREGRVDLEPRGLRLPRRTSRRPTTVNPSLWRQARLNMNNGLFQVTDRIYQVRGFDISNMTIIEGEPRRHRHRSADLDRGRPRRPRALLPASRAQAGHGGDLHATATSTTTAACAASSTRPT